MHCPSLICFVSSGLYFIPLTGIVTEDESTPGRLMGFTCCYHWSLSALIAVQTSTFIAEMLKKVRGLDLLDSITDFSDLSLIISLLRTILCKLDGIRAGWAKNFRDSVTISWDWLLDQSSSS